MAPRESVVRCQLPSVVVQGREWGRVFQVGDEVDLEGLAAPGVTWREALGVYAETAFVPVDDAATQE